MNLFLILLIAFVIILLIALGISYYAYCIAFKAPKRVDFSNYTLPPHEQYIPHYATITRYMDALIARPYEEICIPSFDGLKLYGRYYDSGAVQAPSKQTAPTQLSPAHAAQQAPHPQGNTPIHILFHGYKSNPYQDGCGGSGLAAGLGHNFILVDQRSHGKSDGNTITFGINERRDVLAWIEYCRERFGKDTPILLWGLSMGAATVLMSTDQNLPENVKGIIADCPFSAPADIIKKVCKDMHFPPRLLYPFIKLGARLFGHFDLEECTALDAVKNAKLPILLFHGEEDRFVPHEMSRRLSEASPVQITFESIPGAGHGLCYMVEAVRYRDAAVTFIESVLNPLGL